MTCKKGGLNWKRVANQSAHPPTKGPCISQVQNQKANFKLPSQPTLRLHNVLNFAKLISPTEEETSGRKSVLDLITRLAVQIWGETPNKDGKIKDIKVEVFGSFLTGLCLPTSDIDIVIFGAVDLYTTVKRALYQLAGELKRLQLVSFMEVIDSITDYKIHTYKWNKCRYILISHLGHAWVS